MKTFFSWLFLISSTIVTFTSCSSASDNTSETLPNSEVNTLDRATPVKASLLKKATFLLEKTANGKVSATMKADLQFKRDGLISSIYVREGESVKENQIIATLNDTDDRLDYESAQLNYEQALIEFEDQMLRLGYKTNERQLLDSSANRVVRIKSGLKAAELRLKEVQNRMEKNSLYAPFGGEIADLKVKTFSQAFGERKFCTLIGNAGFEVAFEVLEEEAPFFKIGSRIQVIPYARPDQIHFAQIVSINPMVSEHGMLRIKAKLNDKKHSLVDGMSVKIIAHQTIPEQLSVPKEAILEKGGRKVVFTVGDQDLAVWNYVETGYENSTHYSIKSGLNVGDTAIYRGNFNLVHGKKLVIDLN